MAYEHVDGVWHKKFNNRKKILSLYMNENTSQIERLYQEILQRHLSFDKFLFIITRYYLIILYGDHKQSGGVTFCLQIFYVVVSENCHCIFIVGVKIWLFSFRVGMRQIRLV